MATNLCSAKGSPCTTTTCAFSRCSRTDAIRFKAQAFKSYFSADSMLFILHCTYISSSFCWFIRIPHHLASGILLSCLALCDTLADYRSLSRTAPTYFLLLFVEFVRLLWIDHSAGFDGVPNWRPYKEILVFPLDPCPLAHHYRF